MWTPAKAEVGMRRIMENEYEDINHKMILSPPHFAVKVCPCPCVTLSTSVTGLARSSALAPVKYNVPHDKNDKQWVVSRENYLPGDDV